MYFGLSEEQQFFKDNVNKFLNDHASLDIVKKIIDNNDLDIKNEIANGSTYSPNLTQAGIYTFYAIDSAGCTSNIVTYSIEMQTNIFEYNEIQRPPIFYDILGRRVDFFDKLMYRP